MKTKKIINKKEIPAIHEPYKRKFFKYTIFLLVLVVVSACGIGRKLSAAGSSSKKDKYPGIKIKKNKDKLRVEIDGKLFTEYNFKEVKRPYFYPVIGPSGVNITRHWPMKTTIKGEEHDHPHHMSLWYTHGEVNGYDFWSNKNGTRIVHEKFLKTDSNSTFITKNKWVTEKNKIVCTDIRTHKFFSHAQYRMIDFKITIHASEGKVVMGDTKEGSMAIRLAHTMRVTKKKNKGKSRVKDKSPAMGSIINSNGDSGKEAWGKRAAWCDYYGPLNNKIVGVAIFDHPENPKHPTWWHVRTYGLFAANAFGVHHFEKKPKHAGDLIIPAGKSVTFRYRFYFHKGDEKQGEVAERYKEYTSF